MSAPVIGITTSVSVDSDGSRQALDHDYVRAVERAGGIPLVVPATDRAETMRAVFDRLDGLVIPGGPGIVQGLVGELPDDLPPVDGLRWTSDALAFDCASDRGLPVLGICYGMQFINARLGGTLFADIQVQLGVAPHSPKRAGGKVPEHPVVIQPRTHLARIIGTSATPTVNSRHLQAVNDLADALVVSARSEDGVIEALESPDGRLIGVQFHPEAMPGTIWARLFTDLITRATTTGNP